MPLGDNQTDVIALALIAAALISLDKSQYNSPEKCAKEAKKYLVALKS